MEIDLTDSPASTSVSTPSDLNGLVNSATGSNASSSLNNTNDNGGIHKRRRGESISDIESAFEDEALHTRPGHGPVASNLSAASASSMDLVATSYEMGESSQWQRSIEKAVKSIVSIRFSQTSAFDTEGADTSEASGFIVDAELGLILTNRHVACAGPFVGEAVCHDHEEVDVYPVYRDPVHDFGILKFDPSKIKYMDVTSIALMPSKAKVGLDIRVVGNDAGEKLSILSGSISRLDRNAPEYGELTYNDFNTFYLQAASSTSGGSSGSPVIDINGDAVALQAGGSLKAATDFFLPLDRVKRALEYIQRGEAVPRGTIQCHFLYRPFDETRRLGLSPATESMVRKMFPKEIGMLVAESVLPKGPASQFMEEGDILVSINGEVITKFVPLEDCMDRNIGKPITVITERGGEQRTFTITVQDLHSITPDRYVEVGGSKVNTLSYQLARNYCIAVGGVYVCEPVGMFRFDSADRGWILTSIDNKSVDTLDEFIEVIQSIPDRERVPVVYHSIMDVHTTCFAVVQMDRHWSRFRLAVRNDVTGLWDFTTLGTPLPAKPIVPATARFLELDESLGPAKILFHSMVKISYYMPCRIDGFPKSRKYGAGLVVDTERGLIVVSRTIVPFAMGDLNVTFSESVVVPGKVVFLHPTHNVAIVSYNPEDIGATPIKQARISPVELVQGHQVNLVAYNHNQRPICLKTVVTDITSVTIPHNSIPRFRGINIDAMTLDTPLAQQCSSGVLADNEGRVQGLWISYLGERNANGRDNEYHLGLDVSVIFPMLKPLQEGKIPQLRSLNIEVMPVQMAQARQMGLTDEWVKKVEDADPMRHQILIVRRMETGSASSKILQELDLILSINGKVITKMQDLDVQYSMLELDMVILRKKQEIQVRVPTDEVEGRGTKRVVVWAGALLHEPHRAVLQQSKTLPSRIYVSGRSRGSPSYMYGIVNTMWITHVNGVSTPDLDAFLLAVKDLPDNSYARIKVLSFDGIPVVLSVKTNMHYWPTTEMVMDDSADCGWRRVAETSTHEGVSSSSAGKSNNSSILEDEESENGKDMVIVDGDEMEEGGGGGDDSIMHQ